MHNKKLILLLSSMTSKELKQCRNYLGTQLDYTTEEFRLFDYIWKSKNKWDSKRLEIERAHRAIKPNTTLKQFESLMSALVVRIEKFIIYHLKDSVQKQYEDQFRLANFYKSRGLDKFFRQSQRKLLDLLTQMPPIDTNLPYLQLQQMHQAFFSNLEDLPENMLEKMMANLTLFYQQRRLVYEIEFKNRKQLYQEEGLKEKDTTSKVLTNQLALLNDGTETVFLQLKKILFKQHQNFSQEHAYRLLIYLFNYASKKIRAGNDAYVLHNNDLYDLGLNKKILLLNGKLPESFLINIITLKSLLPTIPLEEIGDLIKNCATYTNTKNPKALQNFSWALFYFIKDEYKKVIEVIDNQIIINLEIRLYLRIELIRLACLYRVENDYLYPDSLITNCRNIFKKHKIKGDENFRIGGLNLIKIIEILWQPSQLKIAKKLEKLHPIIASKKPLTYRSWVNKEIKRLTQNDASN